MKWKVKENRRWDGEWDLEDLKVVRAMEWSERKSDKRGGLGRYETCDLVKR